jgi:hypothetical protein
MELLKRLLLLPIDFASWLAKRFLNLSLAARIGWAVASLQLLVVLLTLAAVFAAGGGQLFRAWWSVGKLLALLALLVIVPLLVYQAARLWLQHESVRWPDIDAAWKEAVIQLNRQQIDLRNTPVFLVLGCDGAEGERAIMQEAATPFLVVAAPAGGSPLHVYAGNEAVFICLSTIGQAAVVAGRLRAAVDHSTPTPLGLTDREQASDRLVALCQRLVNARQPVAAINGVIAFVPIAGRADASSYAAAGAAVAEDVSVLSTTLGLRAPLLPVFSGAEQLSGFDNLLSQLPAADRTRALGGWLPLNLTADSALPAGLATHTAGALLDLTARSLLDPRLAGQPSFNRSLMGLLYDVRIVVVGRLEAFFTELLGHSSHGETAPLLAGSLLAATAVDPARRGFLRGMFERFVPLQGELEWTPARWRRETRNRRLATALKILNLLLVLAIAGIIVWRVAW